MAQRASIRQEVTRMTRDPRDRRRVGGHSAMATSHDDGHGPCFAVPGRPDRSAGRSLPHEVNAHGTQEQAP
jgi:hypothetical protein